MFLVTRRGGGLSKKKPLFSSGSPFFHFTLYTSSVLSLYGQVQAKPMCSFDWIHLHDETGRQINQEAVVVPLVLQVSFTLTTVRPGVAFTRHISNTIPSFLRFSVGWRFIIVVMHMRIHTKWIICMRTCCTATTPQIIGQFHCMLRSLNHAESTRDAIKIGGGHLRRRKENQKKGLQSKVSHIAPIPWCGHHRTHAHNHITRAGIRLP